MTELFAAVNGALLPVSQASLLVSDLSIQRGYGIFDFFKTLSGRPPAWLNRYQQTATPAGPITSRNRLSVTQVPCRACGDSAGGVVRSISLHRVRRPRAPGPVCVCAAQCKPS